jgi:hypothetical protein
MASDVEGEYKPRHRVCLPTEICATPAGLGTSAGDRTPKSPSKWQCWPSLMLRSAYSRNWSTFGEPSRASLSSGMQAAPCCSAYVLTPGAVYDIRSVTGRLAIREKPSGARALGKMGTDSSVHRGQLLRIGILHRRRAVSPHSSVPRRTRASGRRQRLSPNDGRLGSGA